MKFFLFNLDKTLLNIAVEKNNYETVEYLITNRHIDINEKSILNQKKIK